jgi:hypothetical protein
MLQRIETTGLVINMDGEYYVNKKNAETLLLVSNIKDHLILLNPGTWNTYHCTQSVFDKLTAKKTLEKAQYILDYTFIAKGQLSPDRNIIGYTDVKTLAKGLKKLSEKTPGEGFILDSFHLKSKLSGQVIFFGEGLEDMKKAVSAMAPDKKVFKPSAINLNPLLQKIGLKPSAQESSSLRPVRRR